MRRYVYEADFLTRRAKPRTAVYGLLLGLVNTLCIFLRNRSHISLADESLRVRFTRMGFRKLQTIRQMGAWCYRSRGGVTTCSGEVRAVRDDITEYPSNPGSLRSLQLVR